MSRFSQLTGTNGSVWLSATGLTGRGAGTVRADLGGRSPTPTGPGVAAVTPSRVDSRLIAELYVRRFSLATFYAVLSMNNWTTIKVWIYLVFQKFQKFIIII